MEGLAEVDVKIRMGSSQMLLESLNDPDVDFFVSFRDMIAINDYQKVIRTV